MLAKQGVLADLYRQRKLLEHDLGPAAIKYDLTIEELQLLLMLPGAGEEISRKELADLVGVNRVSLTLMLQKLIGRDLLQVEESQEEEAPGGGKRLKILLQACSCSNFGRWGKGSE